MADIRALITRPEEDAASLADALRQRGVAVDIEPLLTIRVLREAALDLSGVQALLFTSANGVRAFAELSRRRDLPALAVGEATAAAARAAGFAGVSGAGGDVRDLARLVKERLQPGDGPLLHAAGSAVAGDLAGALEAAGFTLRRAVLYEAKPAERLSADTRMRLREGGFDWVLFFSPRTAATFVKLIEAASPEERVRLDAGLARTEALCLSPAVADTVQGLPWRSVLSALKPDLSGMLQLVDATLTEGQPAQPEAAAQEVVPPVSSGRAAPGAATPAEAAPPAGPPPAPAPRGFGMVGTAVLAALVALVVAGLLGLTRESWEPLLSGPGTIATSSPSPTPDAASRERLDAVVRRIDAIDRHLESTDRTLETLGQKLAALPAAPAGGGSPEAAPALPPAITGLPERVAGLEQQLKALGEQPAPAGTPALPADVAGLPDRLGQLEQKLQQLAATLPQQQQAAQADQAALDRLQQAVDGLRNEVAAAQSQLARLQGVADKLPQLDRAIAELRRQRETHGALVLAAGQLATALGQSRPFASELATLRRLAAERPELAGQLAPQLDGVAPWADKGIPTLAELKERFPATARAVLQADTPEGGFGAQLLGRVERLVTVRPIGADVEGGDPPARIARAEAKLAANDLAGVVAELGGLEGEAGKAAADWLAAARARLAAEQAAAGLQAAALAGPAAPGEPAAPAPAAGGGGAASTTSPRRRRAPAARRG
jgi:uroporphyrinogen-III synthase